TLAEGTSTEAPPVGKRWQRALILLAGPGMNFVLAILLHTAVFIVGVRVPAFELAPAVIGYVKPGSPAALADIRPGDRFVSINGTETPRYRDAQYLMAMAARERLDVVVERGGSRFTATFTPQPTGKYDIGDAGVTPEVGNNLRGRIDLIVGGGPAEAAGLKTGDVIYSVGGQDIVGGPTEMQDRFIAVVQQNAPGPFPIV